MPLNHEGMFPHPPPNPPPVQEHSDDNHFNSRSPPFLKMDFPKFDGAFPRLWRDRCEMFFEVYSVPPMLKTRFAALNFKGVVATWLQTFERKGRITDWARLYELVLAKFDKN